MIFVLITVVVGATFLWKRTPVLTVSFLNVGQGDAIFIEGPTGIQMLVDGGRDRSVLRELTKRMGPLDRSIDIVVATHPDADHIGGLVGVFQNYRVSNFMSSHIASDTNTSLALLDVVEHEQNINVHVARRGQRIELGGGAYADILFPDRDVSHVETNTGSVIMRVVYGESEFMLTGDSPQAIEDYLVSLDGPALQSGVLKAGHHGSRTSTSDRWLSAVLPSAVVISAGEHNSYGHPHQEVLEKVQALGARIVYTFDGAVTFVSNGTRTKQR